MNLARNKKNNPIDDELPNDFVLPKGDKVKGEKLFKKHCKQCHSIAPDNTQSNSGFTSWGPSLFNVYNRTAGMSKGNSPFQVSPDMYASGIIWNDLNLMKYMRNPKDFVEANIGMNFKGISNFQDRVDIVHYLKTLTYDDPHGREIVEKFSKKKK
ncbi:cytochrome c [Plasmodium inui San Antonio 1]|uniref:Cytochrome c n=1 Tax=Plasmodium inui San Antonio 1 TaxID=1237626 RepID=W7AIF2_9APIC|nr:cytochrome c [Plasmodium inui San Antonio 1]EUD68804.1 cytochrome c [Plasmodium inui San Antonio 1]